MLRFFIVLAIATLMVWIGLKVSIKYDWIQHAPSFSLEILALLFIATLIIFYKLIRVHKNTFVQFYLLSMAVKILAYASFNLIVVMKDINGAPANVLFFMLVYTLFTVLEIVFLYRRFSTPGRA